MVLSIPLSSLILALGTPAELVQDVSWRDTLAGALSEAEAVSEAEGAGVPVLLALYTAEEARSEAALRTLHRDRDVKRALAACIPVQALVGDASKAAARRFGGHDLDTHRGLELEVRDLVPGNEEGARATPQHLWLRPDGSVLVSAPWELASEEFLWLDWRARALLDADTGAPPEGARAPRRYLEGEAFVPADGDLHGRGLLEDERDAALDVLRRRGGGGGRGRGAGGFGATNFGRDGILAFVRLALTDDDPSQDQIRQELGNAFLRMGGFGAALVAGGLEVVAYHAPERGVEVVLPFLGDNVPEMRARAAAALEAMGYAVGWSDVRKALSKEEEPAARQALLRAAGVVGRGDAGARRLLAREATRAKDSGDRAAALLGLGHLGDAAGTADELREGARDGDRRVSLSAAAGMALTRDAGFRADLVALREGRPEDAPLLDGALEVLDGAPLMRLRALMTEVTRDELPRPRLFFEARPPASVRGGEMLGGGGRGRGGEGGGGTGGGGTGGGGTGGGEEGGGR